MSEFEREVDEAVREDQTKVLAAKYGPWVVGVIVVVLGAVGGYNLWENYRIGQSESRSGQLIAGLDVLEEEPLRAAEALAGLEGEGSADFQAVTALTEAAARLQAGETETALRLYDRLAADGEASDYWRYAAGILGVLHRMDAGDPDALLLQLAPLTVAENPWRHSARELSGFLLLKKEDTAAARAQFQAMFDDPLTPTASRARAREMLDSLAAGEQSS